MPVFVARTAGFCFGVNKAVSLVYELLDRGKKVYTLGPIIHNPQLTAALEARGVEIIGSPEDLPPTLPDNAVAVIRSHGVTGETEGRLRATGAEVCDATCPFVAKIHRIAADCGPEGLLLIAGDPRHPEVEGIRGHCACQNVVFQTPEELEKIFEKYPEKYPAASYHTVTAVAQTTFQAEIFKECIKKIKKHYTNASIFDTICNATAERQAEAVALAEKSDLMVIVGGRQSSNTAGLRDVCAPHCKTVLVETAAELDPSLLKDVRTVGLTSGASTPAEIMKEVLNVMSDMLEKENEVTQETEKITPEDAVPETAEIAETAVAAEGPAEAEAVQEAVEDAAPEAAEETQAAEEAAPAEEAKSAVPTAEPTAEPAEEAAPPKSFDEMTFEEAMEASLKTLSTDEKVRGIVVAINPSEVQVEVIGRKQTGYVPAEEMSADPNANPADLVKVGDEMELLIMKTDDQEGTIMLSKKRIDAQKGWDVILAAEQSGDILDGVITDVIKGGVLAVTNGVRVFIPASLASVVRLDDLSVLKGQPARFRIIETNIGRRRAVASVRAASREDRKEKEEAFWSTAEVGQAFHGQVKSLTSYGAFVDLGGVDGMVHISELSWTRIKHPSEVVKVGDMVDVYIRDLNPEKKKISLGFKKAGENPWEIFKAEYPIGTVTSAKVVGMTSFGAFAQILPGVDGLIHISQIADRRIEKPQDALKIGEEVTVKITNVDYDAKRISLSIRALLEPDMDGEEAAEEEEEILAEEAAVDEAGDNISDAPPEDTEE